MAGEPASSEVALPSAPGGDTRRWLRRWAAVAALMLVLTYFANASPDAAGVYLGPFDLGRESNAAAWFSACSLWWSGLLTISAAASLRGRDAAAAAALFFLGCVALTLGVDEAGSLHERFDLLVPGWLGLSLKKVAAVGAVPVLAALGVLFLRRATLGRAWALLLGAYALFGTVFAQEILEHAVAWPPRLLPLRMVVEEGTELCGFFLLLWAAVKLRERCRGPLEAWAAGHPPEAVLPGRTTLVGGFVVCACVAPALILWSLSIPIDELSLGNRGDFASTMMMAMFLVAAAICWRSASAEAADPAGWRRLAAGCLLLSLVQNWHAYTDAWRVLFGRLPPHLWRTAYDMAWALPVFVVLAMTVRTRPAGRAGLAVLCGLLWATYLVAAYRTGFRLSYASSYAAAALIGVWVILATRESAAGPARRPSSS